MRFRVTTYAPFLCATGLLLGCDRAEERSPTAPTASVKPQLNLIGASEPPEWVGALLSGPTIFQADGESTQEELPGLGHKFELQFAMDHDQDPQNPTNDVISVVTTESFPAGSGTAVRNLPPGIKITALDHQMNLKYFFPTRSCAGGSPRFQLAIDLGDGTGSHNAFGYVGHAPFGTGCITGEWDIIDMTDNVGRWDLSQFPGGGMTMTWDMAEALIAAFPNHQVLSGALVDDSCGFAPTSCGQAYYDLVTMENRTLENRQDAVKKH